MASDFGLSEKGTLVSTDRQSNMARIELLLQVHLDLSRDRLIHRMGSLRVVKHDDHAAVRKSFKVRTKDRLCLLARFDLSNAVSSLVRLTSFSLFQGLILRVYKSLGNLLIACFAIP